MVETAEVLQVSRPIKGGEKEQKVGAKEQKATRGNRGEDLQVRVGGHLELKRIPRPRAWAELQRSWILKRCGSELRITTDLHDELVFLGVCALTLDLSMTSSTLKLSVVVYPCGSVHICVATAFHGVRGGSRVLLSGQSCLSNIRGDC